MNIDAVSGSNPLKNVGPGVEADARPSDPPDVMLPDVAIVRENQSRVTKNEVLEFIGHGVALAGMGIGLGAMGLSLAVAAGGLAMCLVGIITFGAYGAGIPLVLIGFIAIVGAAPMIGWAGLCLCAGCIAAMDEISSFYNARKVPERDDINAGPEVSWDPLPGADINTDPEVSWDPPPGADINTDPEVSWDPPPGEDKGM